MSEKVPFEKLSHFECLHFQLFSLYALKKRDVIGTQRSSSAHSPQLK